MECHNHVLIVLFQCFHGVTRENHKNSGYPVSWQKLKPSTSHINIWVLFICHLFGVDIYSASILENPTVTSVTFILELWIVTYFTRAWQALKTCGIPTSIHTHFWQVSRINTRALYIPYIPSELTAVYLP